MIRRPVRLNSYRIEPCLLPLEGQESSEMIRKIEIERFSLTCAKPFDQDAAALDAAIGHPDMAKFARSTHEARSFAELKRAVEKGLSEAGLMRFMQLDHGAVKLFGEWRSSDEVCEIWRSEPLNVSNAKIPKNVVNRRHRFLTNDVAKTSFKSVLECQPRKCG
jgi:hypothetical protein